jgi:hypothetical protein
MHHVTFGTGPKRRRVPPQIFGHLLDRQYRPISNVAGQTQGIAAGESLADFRPYAVTANDGIGSEHRTIFGADLCPSGRVVRADDALLVDERYIAVPPARIEQNAM